MPLSATSSHTLQSRLGMELPSTLVFDYPSVAAITAFITGQLAEEAGEAEMRKEGAAEEVRTLICISFLTAQDELHNDAVNLHFTGSLTQHACTHVIWGSPPPGLTQVIHQHALTRTTG